MKLREGKFVVYIFAVFVSLFFFSNQALAQQAEGVPGGDAPAPIINSGSNKIGSGQPAPGPFDPQTSSSTFGNLEVGLPGTGIFSRGKSIDSFISGAGEKPILTLVNLLVTFLTGILVIVGVITIVLGGYLYMTAAGNGSQVQKAKEMITAALIGIFIAFISVTLLNTINSALGTKAVEPTLGDSGSSGGSSGIDPDSFGTGGGSGNGSGGGGTGTNTGNTNGSGSSDTSNNGNTSNTNTGNSTTTFPFKARQTAVTSSEHASILIDDRQYYIRTADGDRPATLEQAIAAGESTPFVLIYENTNVRTSAFESLRGGLIDAGIESDFIKEIPITNK